MKDSKWASSFVLVFVSGFLSGSASKVRTTLGEIEGITEAVGDVTVDIYLGIPYAKPPIGNLRFRAPQPAEKWTGVKETKTQPNSCIQSLDTNFGRFKGVEKWNANTNISEDCLYLNIWVPRPTSNQTATMIWIYGGAFSRGTITLEMYDGRYLAARNGVIVVSMQYRLGAIGFLYTGTEEAPGNMGLLDQQHALKWVHENIDRFGGHGDQISLFGQSAGAASVSHHLFSKLSWPYFTNAIMLSGSSFAPWAVSSPETLLELVKSLAEKMDCLHDDMKEMVNCLREKDAMEIERKAWLLNGRIFPTVDGTFMSDYPQKLLQSGRIKMTNILLGNTKDEANIFLYNFFPDVFPEDSVSNPAPLNRSQFLDVVCRIAQCKGDLDRDGLLYTYEESRLPVARGIYREILDDMLGDSFFKCPVRALANYHTKSPTGRTYVYSIEYRHSDHPWPSWMGVAHGFDVDLVFGQPFNRQLNYSDLDREVSDKVMSYLATFAKTGSLDSFGDEWPEYNTNTEQHIVFTQNGTTHTRDGFRTKECSFWEYLLPKLRQQPSGPSDVLSRSSVTSCSTYVTLVCLLTTLTTGFTNCFCCKRTSS